VINTVIPIVLIIVILSTPNISLKFDFAITHKVPIKNNAANTNANGEVTGNNESRAAFPVGLILQVINISPIELMPEWLK
jgi:hypothetical protein